MFKKASCGKCHMCNVFNCLFLSIITYQWNVWQMRLFVVTLILCVYLQEYISSIFCILMSDSLAYKNVTVLKVCIAGLWLTDSTHALCIRGRAPVLHKHSLVVGKYKPSSFPTDMPLVLRSSLFYTARVVWTFSMTLELVLLLCMFLGTHGFNTQLVIEPQPNFDVEKVSMSFQLFGLFFYRFWGKVVKALNAYFSFNSRGISSVYIAFVQKFKFKSKQWRGGH